MALDQYLKIFNKDKITANYIKIGDAELNVFGNKYHITNDNLNEVYENYKKHVFENYKEAYIVERQLDNGKIAIDLDFRYDSLLEKQHTNDHITDFIELCMNGFNDLFEDLNDKISFIFSKKKTSTVWILSRRMESRYYQHCCRYFHKIVIPKYILENIEDVWANCNLKTIGIAL